MTDKPVDYPHSELTDKIISSAIEVHKVLGPGLLESAYEEALAHEFDLRGIKYVRQQVIDLLYKGKDTLYMIDCLISQCSL
jgi:GxxExxY protein